MGSAKERILWPSWNGGRGERRDGERRDGERREPRLEFDRFLELIFNGLEKPEAGGQTEFVLIRGFWFLKLLSFLEGEIVRR
jgi:hypothetical protein